MRVLGAALCALFGALFLVMYNDHPGWTWGWRLVLLILAFAMGALMLMFIVQAFLVDILPLIDDHKLRVAYRQAITPEGEIIKLINQMQPYQADIFLRKGVMMVNIPHLTGPDEVYRFPVTKPAERAGLWEVPAEFVETYMSRADHIGLDAVRNYPQGPQRDHAQHITDFYVEHRLANEARGNRSATWTVSLAQALQWIGWKEAEDGLA